MVTTEDGIRMVQSPIKELESLRKPLYSASNKWVSPSSGNLLKGIISGAYEIKTEIEIPEASTVTEFGFNIREGANQKMVVGYTASESNMKRLHKWRIVGSRCVFWWMSLPLRPLVVFSDVLFPDPARICLQTV